MSADTKISRYHVIGIALFGLVLIFSHHRWHSASPGHSQDQDVPREKVMANEPPIASPGSTDPTRTKSRIRPDHAKPTIAETTELIRTTIIPVLDLPPDQPLPERFARINELIQKVGVEPHRLRLIIRSGDPALNWRSRGELRIREVPVAVAVKYIIDNTRLRCEIRENGIVELTSLSDEDLESESPHRAQIQQPSPPGETDIFGNDPYQSEQNDPFAVPIPVR